MKRLLSIITSLACALSSHAQVTRQSFSHYTSADGLPSNCIRDILQDSCGFMWFATDGGVARFDGYNFKVFEPTSLQCHNHVDNYVSCLARNTGRGLWVATDNGLLRYDATLEALTEPSYLYTPGEEDCLRGSVRRMASDHAGTLWVAMTSGGINSVDTDMQVKHYSLPSPPGTNSAGCVFVDTAGTVWVTGSHNTNGLYRYDPVSERFVPVPVTIDGSETDIRSMAITEDHDGTLWIGLWDRGLLSYDPVTGVAHLFTAPDTQSMFHVHSAFYDNDGTILMGTDAGLTVFDPETSTFTLYAHDELQPGSMSGQFVYPIVRDQEGGLWIGTFYGGVNYHAPQLKYFDSASHSRYVNSVSGNIISSFCQDSRGNLYIGSEDGGLCRYDATTRRYTAIPLVAGSNSDNIHTLCADGDNLWIGTYSGGIKVYNVRSGRVVRDFSSYRDSQGNPITACYSLFKDRRGTIWAATMNAVLSYNRDTDSFDYRHDAGALVSDIAQDLQGNLWFSTQGNGLHRYDPRHDQWTLYRSGTQPGALIHNHVSNIDIDDDGQLWVATGNGLASYDRATDSFTEVKTDSPSRMIFFVKSYGPDLWLGTASGLVRHTPGGETMVYNVVDGLAADQFTLNSVYQATDGSLYTGTVNGFTHFDPARVGKNMRIPPLQFTGLDVQGRHIEVGDPLLPSSLNSLQRLDLGPDDYSFSIGFAALSFVNPDNNTYMYRLEGFDKEWMVADNNHRATYTSLPPGDYTLQVKAANNDKVWNEAGISLPIRISPHWYNTVAMKSVYLLLIITLLSTVTYLVMKRNNRRHTEELELIRSRQDKEVYEAKLNFFTTIAHEIRTPVSLIIGPLESVMKSSNNFTGRQHDDIDIIYRNAQRLLILINQLLDFKKVESLAMDVRYASTDIPSLVRSITERFRSSLQLRGITLEVNCESDHFNADVDAEALTKMVSNLLNNARKFTRSWISLECRHDETSDHFVICVRDNGTGIDDRDLQSIFKPFVQLDNGLQQEGGTGLGLSIVKRVVKAHNGTIEVRSTPGEGTSFIVKLPLAQDASKVCKEIADENAQEGSQHPSASHIPAKSTIAGEKNEHPVMLVADDNPDLVHFLSSYFSPAYTVLTAENADKAIQLLADNEVDFIISDWMMPGMSGVDLCRHVRSDRATSHIPFLLLTARTDDDSKIEGLNCGADAYVEKPFSVEYLAARINNLLELRQLLRQRFSTAPLEPIETLAVNTIDSEFLTRLTKIIEENFTNSDLSVDFLAQEMGISRTGLYAKIKTLVDNTPNELIQITRLKRAAQLLSEGRYRINEICYMVGFNSPSYFTKCFQRQFGMKPGEFNLEHVARSN